MASIPNKTSFFKELSPVLCLKRQGDYKARDVVLQGFFLRQSAVGMFSFLRRNMLFPFLPLVLYQSDQLKIRRYPVPAGQRSARERQRRSSKRNYSRLAVIEDTPQFIFFGIMETIQAFCRKGMLPDQLFKKNRLFKKAVRRFFVC
jgi:hypothetical protein